MAALEVGAATANSNPKLLEDTGDGWPAAGACPRSHAVKVTSRQRRQEHKIHTEQKPKKTAHTQRDEAQFLICFSELILIGIFLPSRSVRSRQ